MAFSFVASSFIDSDSLTTLVINKPTGTVDDDIMFTIIHRPSGGAPSSVPSGWTSIGTQPNYFLYWKKASSEGASYSWGFSGSVRTGIALGSFRGGFNLTTPIDVVSNTTYTTNNTICRAASMTVTNTNSPIIYLGTVLNIGGSTTFTPPTVPSTFTEHYDGGDVNGDAYFEIASMIWSGSGATGNIDGTLSTSGSSKHAFAVALVPDVIGNTNGNFFMMFN